MAESIRGANATYLRLGRWKVLCINVCSHTGGGLSGTRAALPAPQLAVGVQEPGSRHSPAEGRGGSTNRQASSETFSSS